jgi:integrase
VVVYTGDGRHKWIGGFTSQAEAEAQRLKIATSPAYGSGLGPHGSMKQRLGSIMADWIEHAECGEKEKASRRSRFKTHVAPRLGHVQLARIAPATVEAFTRELTGISSTTARKVFEDLRMCLGYCLRMGYTSANPCDSVDKPRRRRYRSPIAQWTREDVSKFFAACEGFGDKGLLFLTTYFTAGRQGEMLGLPWEQVDFGEHTVTFVQDLERRQGERATFDDTKTQTSDRTVLVPSWLIDALRVLRRKHAEERLRRGPCEHGRECKYQHCKRWHPWNLVFTQANGKPLQGRDVTQRDLKKLCQQAEVPVIRFHDLRHLHNTILMRRNVNAGIIKSRAGHSSAAFSLDRYAWASLDRKEQAVAVTALEQSLQAEVAVSKSLAGPQEV